MTLERAENSNTGAVTSCHRVLKVLSSRRMGSLRLSPPKALDGLALLVDRVKDLDQRHKLKPIIHESLNFITGTPNKGEPK